MLLNYVLKEPDKAYVSNALWLPKAGIKRVEPYKTALSFSVKGEQGKLIDLEMWEESRHHLICPREFLSPSNYPSYRFPFVDARPSFERAHFVDKVVPRNEEQQRAWAALSTNDNGILNLACGKGKTRLAIKKIAQKQVPTLVVVPDGGILSQWKESLFGNKAKGIVPGIGFDGELGLIQGDQFEWDKGPITLALVTTLALRIKKGRVPEEMFRRYGLIVYDEVHQIGAPIFSLTASPFYGDRIGLTATVQREDGLDPIYRYHIGEPFYSDLSQDLVPRIYFQKTPANIRYQDARAEGSKTTNIGLLRSMLGQDLEGNVFRYWAIREALDEGRKVLCLSHSKAQLKLFHALFPGSALITGDTERDSRMESLRQSRICFAIARLGSTGVDDDALDTLFWLTPFRSKIALQQSMGRIQRVRPGKKTPVMMVFEDWMAPPLRQLCNTLRANLKEWGYTFETFKPRALPTQFPPEVVPAYERVIAHLTLEERSADSRD